MIRIVFLILLFFQLSPQSVSAHPPYRFITGGPIRLGGFTLVKTAADNYETDIAYQEKKIYNTLGEFFFLGVEYDRVGAGIRWMKYSLEGTSSELQQTLDLEYQFLTSSIVLFKNIFHQSKSKSRIGLTFGLGQNHYLLSTKTSTASVVKKIDDSFSSTADAALYELYMTSVTRKGWGYKLGIFRIDAIHTIRRTNNQRVNGSSENSYYITAVWQF